MCERIAGLLGCSLDQVNVKAKTAEKLGPVGRQESIEARAVCLLRRT
jgi:2-C-methyl-D-erythritol 2,4-cyclodiphosphate synthase